MEKRYVSNRWPHLKILGAGPKIEFLDGLFVTADPAAQDKIEGHGDFGIHVFSQDDYVAPPVMEEPHPEQAPESTLVIGAAHEEDPPPLDLRAVAGAKPKKGKGK